MKGFRILGWIALLAATAAVLAAALAALAWRSLAARDGEWSQPLTFTVLGRRVEQRVGMAVLLRLATHPLAAKAIDGRSFDSAQGRWHVAARPDGAVSARCEPCRFTLAALGPAPLPVDRAEVVLHADGADQYRGTLALGRAPQQLVLQGQGRFDHRGRFTLDAHLRATPLAHVVHALGSDLPERDRVQVHGTLALELRARWPDAAWTIEPVIDGFEVFGLGTEQLADLQRPAACRTSADAGVNTLTGWLPRAVIAAEDQRFFEHPGYDLAAMVDAWRHNQSPGQPIAGASTLTQQLAKLTVAGDERSAARKLRELLYAVEMERTLGKAHILQLYLALAPWGEGVCGAERAVRVHLGQRDATAVGPVAAAWLASLLPAPDALLRAERSQGRIDSARVAHVIEGLRPMRADRREKALDTLPFWSPPGLPPSPAVTASP